MVLLMHGCIYLFLSLTDIPGQAWEDHHHVNTNDRFSFHRQFKILASVELYGVNFK